MPHSTGTVAVAGERESELASSLLVSAVCCVVPDVMWFSAQSAARELGLLMLGLMTSSAVSFRTININYVGFIC
jgi:hypothetical protein